MMKKLFLLLWLVLLTCGLAQAQGDELPRFLEVFTCFIAIPREVVGEYDCGYVLVPEDRSDPESRIIRLAVIRFHATGENPQPAPFLLASGGPGAGLIGGFQTRLNFAEFRPGWWDEVLESSDIILFDQRGTGFSAPFLGCPQVSQAQLEILTFGMGQDGGREILLQAYETCRDELLDEGVNLSEYNSLENTADVDAIRDALGYDRINFYGVSYGSMIGQHLLREYPEHLQSVVLDGVVPLEISLGLDTAIGTQEAYERLFAACEADRACSFAYGDLEAAFYDVYEELQRSPRIFSVEDEETGEFYDVFVDGDLIVLAFFQAMYSRGTLAQIPFYLDRLGNYDLVSTQDSKAFFGQITRAVLLDDRSYGMHLSVICSEEMDYVEDELDLTDLNEPFEQNARINIRQYLDACPVWDVPTLEPIVSQPVTSNVPVLLLSGEFDPITPPAFAQMVASHLPLSYNYTFSGFGHGQVLGSNPCADQILFDFLANPYTEPESECVTVLRITPRFRLP